MEPASGEAWDVGARVAISGAVDSGRWATLGPLVQRALECGRAVVVADQGLDPLADQLEALADTLGVPFQRWPAQQAGSVNRLLGECGQPLQGVMDAGQIGGRVLSGGAVGGHAGT